MNFNLLILIIVQIMQLADAQYFEQSYRSNLMIKGKVHSYWARRFSRESVLKSIVFKPKKAKMEQKLKRRLQFRSQLFSRFHAKTQ